MKRIKDKLYYYFAEKNWGVRREYGPYVDQHQEEHAKTPWKHWWLLIRLNWHYRIRRKETFLIYNAANNDTSQRLPYLEGAESELSIRRDALHFAKDLLQFDVISFDIFDTLVFRPFKKPSDIFMIVGGKLNCINFHWLRQEAEKAARDEKFKETGLHEITLEDIYNKLEIMTGIPAGIGLETEFQAELDLCFANPYMKRVFRILKDQKKKIIATSDMYLSHDRMVKLLEKCGYTGFEKVYVSCDYGASKRTGGLYDIIKRDFPEGTSFVHIGDNSVSDIKSAEEKNITAKLYRNVNHIGNKYRADGMSELIGSAYAGVVNAYLHNGLNTYSPHYEYGFIYGGIYVLGYVNWIHQRAISEGIEKIFFLSRDGDIYMKVYNYLFNDIPCEYFYWSRIANVKSTVDTKRSNFIKGVVNDRLNKGDCLIKDLLILFELDELISMMEKYFLSEDDYLTKETSTRMLSLLHENWSVVTKKYEPYIKAAEQIILESIGSCKRVAVVDVGWIGTSPLSIKSLVEEIYKLPCKVHCYIAASQMWNNTSNILQITDKTLDTYIFSQNYNRNLYDIHRNTNQGTNNIYFEFFSQATIPSFGGYFLHDGMIEYRFDIPEVENYEIINEIHQGILDFVNVYYKHFSSIPEMLNISGSDAYMPYRFIIRDLSFIEKHFGSFLFERDIGGNAAKQNIVALHELWSKIGVTK